MKNTKNQKEEVNIEKLYGKQCTLPKEDFIKEFHIKEKGLSSNEAEDKITKYGLNEIRQAKPKKWYHYFLESLFSPFNSILLRNCCNPYLYRCLFTRNTKLCKYYCYCYFGNCKYFIRIF